MRKISGSGLAALIFFCSTLGALEVNFPIRVRGSGEASFNPKVSGPALVDPNLYDAVVVGGGLAGLTAALYLSDYGKQVLLLEKEAEFGGLAFGGERPHEIRYARGASYFTEAYPEELRILERIGMGDYKDRYAIHEPSDSYFWNGRLYLGIWEEETLEELPASFALFKHELELADKDGHIPNQPFEERGTLSLDQLNAADWIRQMPLATSLREDRKSRHLYKHFLEDPRINRKDPMADVIGLIELYCRSALGTTPEKISAVAFANFYISELSTRYTTETGTGGAAERLVRLLRQRPQFVSLRASVPVVKVRLEREKVVVDYVQNGKLIRAQGKFGVFAAPLKLLPKMMDKFETLSREKSEVLKDLRYAHYNVHNVFVEGHPYRATYDTWTRASDANDRDFADLILGRWVDPAIRGYLGMRNFEKDPGDDEGVMSLYQPLPLERVGGGYTEEEARDDALYSVERMLELYGPLLKEKWGTTIKVRAVETNRWPFSIHIVAPGFFTMPPEGSSQTWQSPAKVLRARLGRLFFANNNIGTPTFEEALFRGHCAANNILSRLLESFTQESWTECPLEP